MISSEFLTFSRFFYTKLEQIKLFFTHFYICATKEKKQRMKNRLTPFSITCLKAERSGVPEF
jgi:hypothetical protein